MWKDYCPKTLAMILSSETETETITLPELEEIELEEDAQDYDVPWNVVLLDDNSHTYAYVVEMLNKIFGYGFVKAFGMAREVDTRKRVVVWTGHRELAEAYQEKIHDYGADWRMDVSIGSMSAILERAR